MNTSAQIQTFRCVRAWPLQDKEADVRSHVRRKQKKDSGRQRATLIVTERAMDVVAPLIHEFTYQAMANDLLPIEDGSKYTCVHRVLCHVPLL